MCACVGVLLRVAATSVVACTILAIFVFGLRSLKKCCCRCWKKSIEPDRQKNFSVANENANKKTFTTKITNKRKKSWYFQTRKNPNEWKCMVWSVWRAQKVNARWAKHKNFLKEMRKNCSSNAKKKKGLPPFKQLWKEVYTGRRDGKAKKKKVCDVTRKGEVRMNGERTQPANKASGQRKRVLVESRSARWDAGGMKTH